VSSSRGGSKKPLRSPGGAPRTPQERGAASLRGAPSARLTIKPGTQQRSSAPLGLSTKPRPSGPCRLSDVPLSDDELLVDGFEATLDGMQVRITAVLERTCVYVDRDGNRRLASKKDVWVEADKLPIRRRGVG
jgi:hypothetical protein